MRRDADRVPSLFLCPPARAAGPASGARGRAGGGAVNVTGGAPGAAEANPRAVPSAPLLARPPCALLPLPSPSSRSPLASEPRTPSPSRQRPLATGSTTSTPRSAAWASPPTSTSANSARRGTARSRPRAGAAPTAWLCSRSGSSWRRGGSPPTAWCGRRPRTASRWGFSRATAGPWSGCGRVVRGGARPPRPRPLMATCGLAAWSSRAPTSPAGSRRAGRPPTSSRGIPRPSPSGSGPLAPAPRTSPSRGSPRASSSRGPSGTQADATPNSRPRKRPSTVAPTPFSSGSPRARTGGSSATRSACGTAPGAPCRCSSAWARAGGRAPWAGPQPPASAATWGWACATGGATPRSASSAATSPSRRPSWRRTARTSSRATA